MTQPIITELTDGKPRFNRGTLVVNTCANQKITSLHCACEDFGWQTRRYDVKDGQIHCNDSICFFYFTDVYPGDGGRVVLPGSYKSNFERPDGLFSQNLEDVDHPIYPPLANTTRKAGDVVVLSELTTHGALHLETDRSRPPVFDSALQNAIFPGSARFGESILGKSTGPAITGNT